MKPDLTKARVDAWDAALDERQRWTAFAQSRRCDYPAFATWLEAEYQIDPPSQSAYYRWIRRMRKLESSHRLEMAIQTAEEVGQLAQHAGLSDGTANAFMALARDVALAGDSVTASRLTGAAVSIAEATRREAELELKKEAQRLKAEALRLQREKFEAAERRLNDVKNVTEDTNLSPEEKETRLKAIFGLK